MTPGLRRGILIGGGVLVAAIAVIGVLIVLPGQSPSARTESNSSTTSGAVVRSANEVADQFLTALQAGSVQSASALTDDPAACAKKFAEIWQALSPKSAAARRTQPIQPTGDTASAPFHLSWVFGAERIWTYDSTLPMVKAGDQWRIHWTPELVHPKLTADRTLAMVGQTNQNAVLDRDGGPLLTWLGAGAKAVDPGFAPLLTPAMARVAGEESGKDGWHVVLVDAAGAQVEKLAGADGQSKAITSTLSVPIQKAAQAAVDAQAKSTMLVAIQPSTGDILAVAQNAAAGTNPKALNGLYPPGSTFKIATATAVLQSGAADSNTMLPCPPTLTIGTRTIPNDPSVTPGDVPMHTAFARSCNTTFAKLASGLGAGALADAASSLGLNADFVLPGFITEAGKVVPAGTSTQRVEDGIGQGTVQASPFGVALMTATVASGKAVTPRLWRGLETTVGAGYQPPPRAILEKVRAMMREAVTGGTARDLAGRGAVFGKTGTAQFGNPPDHSHGWFAGYRGDLAFVVLVESGESSSPAVATANKFLAGVR
jgi:hypothetical protein